MYTYNKVVIDRCLYMEDILEKPFKYKPDSFIVNNNYFPFLWFVKKIKHNTQGLKTGWSILSLGFLCLA